MDEMCAIVDSVSAITDSDNGKVMEKFNIKEHELEFKYDGCSVNLDKFNEFANSMKPGRYLEVASWDIYYSPVKDSPLPFEFMRLRLGPKPELTIKIKKDEKNNNNRIEIDVPLAPNISDKELIESVVSFTKQFGFVENFRIFKYCSIFFYEKTDIVFYIVYDEGMKEKGRFIEVEARKDVEHNSEEEAWNEVKALEQKLSVFGISPQNRSKKSQWERNRR